MIEKITSRETIFALLATALAYVVTFNYKREYLSYFQVDVSLVSVDVTAFGITAVTLVGLAQFSLNVFGAVPSAAVRWFFFAIIGFYSPVVGLIFVVVFLASGFSWPTMILFLIYSPLLIIDLRAVLVVKRRGDTVIGYLEKSIDDTANFREKTLEGQLIEKIGQDSHFLILTGFILPVVLAGAFGSYKASSDKDFALLKIHDSTYAVLADIDSGFVVAEVFPFSGVSDHIEMTGRTAILTFEEVSGVKMNLERFNKVSVPTGRNPRWITFHEFKQRMIWFLELGGEPCFRKPC